MRNRVKVKIRNNSLLPDVGGLVLGCIEAWLVLNLFCNCLNLILHIYALLLWSKLKMFAKLTIFSPKWSTKRIKFGRDGSSILPRLAQIYSNVCQMFGRVWQVWQVWTVWQLTCHDWWLYLRMAGDTFDKFGKFERFGSWPAEMVASSLSIT